MLVHDVLYDTNTIGRTLIPKPKQHYTMMYLATTKYQFSKILIVRDEDAMLIWE